MSKFQEKISELKNLASNDISCFFSEIFDLLKTESNNYDNFLVLKNSHQNLNKRINIGVLNLEEIVINENKILLGVLKQLNVLIEKDLISEEQYEINEINSAGIHDSFSKYVIDNMFRVATEKILLMSESGVRDAKFVGDKSLLHNLYIKERFPREFNEINRRMPTFKFIESISDVFKKYTESKKEFANHGYFDLFQNLNYADKIQIVEMIFILSEKAELEIKEIEKKYREIKEKPLGDITLTYYLNETHIDYKVALYKINLIFVINDLFNKRIKAAQNKS